jgi:UDP-N-acetylglucosamine 2-epimerase
MHIVSIVGARPEFVQAAPITRALRPRHTETLIHTGQHYDYEMSAVFFKQLGLPEPDHNLGVGSGNHAWQTGQILIKMGEVLQSSQPDWVVVRGDTNSTLAGALAAVKLGQPLVHIEAGLRSFNKAMPEEINRVVTDRIADVLFCPTQAALDNLATEGIVENVFRVGDVMYDGLLYNLALAEAKSTILKDLKLEPGTYLMATVHRASNTDICENLANILTAFGQAPRPVIFPAHPRTRKRIENFGLEIPENVLMIKPLNYFDSLILQKHAHRLLTDSGGMQKEAYCLNTPCITLREQTEWVETVEAGWNILVGANGEQIVDALHSFVPPTEHPPLYGDGHAAERIVQTLADLLSR